MFLQPTRQNRLKVEWEGPADVVEKLPETNYAGKLPVWRKRSKFNTVTK